MKPLRNSKRPWLRFLIGLAISIAAFYFVLRDFDFAVLSQTLATVRWGYLVLGVLTVLLNNLFKSSRWYLLNLASPSPPGFQDVMAQFFVGQTINMIIPGRLGDVSRIQNIGVVGGSRSYVAGTIGVEKLVDLIAYAILFGVLFLFMPAPEWLAAPSFSMIGIAVLLILFLIGLVRYWRKLIFIWVKIAVVLPNQIDQLVQRGKYSLHSLELLKQSRNLLSIIGLTIFIWATAILNNYLLLQALNIKVPVVASLLILIALMAGINFSVVPGTFGVFEFVCVLALASFGVDQHNALGFGILLHAVAYLPVIFVGVLYLWSANLMNRKPKLSPNKDA